ncbi:MAG: PAS domain S-box protein, partial [Kiloniellales bacterium]
MTRTLRPLTSYLILGAAIVVFVASLASSVSRLYDIEQDMARDVGENANWTMAQNEVEILLFLDGLSRFVDGDAGMTRAGLLRRFDLLWSRLAVAQGGEVAERLRTIEGALPAIEAAQQTLAELEPRIQALALGESAEAQAIGARLRALLPALHQASVATWQAEIAHYTDRRVARQEALLGAITHLLGLVVSMGVLVALLLLELRRRRHLAEQAGAAEQAARVSEARFRDVVEAASDWVWETGREHSLTFISDRLRELSGEEAEDVLGKTRRELRLADDHDGANWEKHQSILDQRLPFRDFTIPYVDADGRRHWARIHGRPVFDTAGNFVGYRGTGRDVTAEREAAEEIKESRALLRAVIDAVPAVINVKDRESRYVLMNRFQGEVYGVDSEAAVGRRSEDFTGERYGEESRAFDQEVIASGQAQPFRERPFVDAKGQKRVWWTAKQPLKDALGAVRHVVTVALDITSLKAMEKARNNLSRYFSPNMVEVLAAKDAPISQVRQQEVAVVFADLFDFTRLCAQATPQEAMS